MATEAVPEQLEGESPEEFNTQEKHHNPLERQTQEKQERQTPVKRSSQDKSEIQNRNTQEELKIPERKIPKKIETLKSRTPVESETPIELTSQKEHKTPEELIPPKTLGSLIGTPERKISEEAGTPDSVFESVCETQEAATGATATSKGHTIPEGAQRPSLPAIEIFRRVVEKRDVEEVFQVSLEVSRRSLKDSRKGEAVVGQSAVEGTEKASGSGVKNNTPGGEGGEEGEGMEVQLPTPENLNSLFAVVKAVKNSHENLSAQEIENKFNQLSLAFRTDGVTLRQRLDLQQRHRDNAEANFNRELSQLRDSLIALHSECLDTELADAVSLARRNLDILTTSSTRVLSNSEVWGAVQQEWRVSRAVEVLLLHVDNVRRMYEREHQELEELRRLLNEYQIELPLTTSQPPPDAPAISRRVRALSLAVCQSNSKPQQESRRTSMTGGGTGRSMSGSFTGARTRRRASLQPDQLKPLRDQFSLASVVAAATAANVATGAGSSKDKQDGGDNTNNKGMLGITEEGSITEESGDESTNQNPPSPPPSTTTTTTTTSNSTTPALPVSPSLPGTESERRLSQDSTVSSISQEAEARISPASSTLTPDREDSLVYLAVERMVGAVIEWWPYSAQNARPGGHYIITTVVALLVVCVLLVFCTASSELPDPQHPFWSNFALRKHPFVTFRSWGSRPV